LSSLNTVFPKVEQWETNGTVSHYLAYRADLMGDSLHPNYNPGALVLKTQAEY